MRIKSELSVLKVYVISLEEELQIISVDTLLSRKWNINSLFLKCELHMMTSFQRVQYGEGKKSNLIVEKPDKTLLQLWDQGQYEQS